MASMKTLIGSHYFYLGLLIISIVALLGADWAYRLAFFYRALATLQTIGVMMLILIASDMAGIGLRIFSTNQQFVSGWHIGSPNFPVEELLFLFLLSYLTLLLYRFIKLHTHSHAAL